MAACDGYGYTSAYTTAGAVHPCGTCTGHPTAWLCLGGKILGQITTALLRDLWAKPCSKEQKWQVWVQSHTQKQASLTGNGSDRSLKHIKGSPALWSIYNSQDRKITLLKELMAQGYFLLASNSAHKTLALSHLKRPVLEVKFPWLLCIREGDFPPPTLSRNDDHPTAPQVMTRGHSDNQKLFPHSSLYAGPLKLQGTACSPSSTPCKTSQPVCHTLPDTTEVLFSLLVQGIEGSRKPWMQLQNLAVTWLGRTLSTVKV